MADSEELKNLNDRVEQLEAIIASIASVSLLNKDDEISLKIDEILSKFNIK